MRILVVVKDFPTAQNFFSGIFILRRLQALQELGHEFKVLRIVPFAPSLGAKWNAYRSIPSAEVVEGIPVQTLRAIIPPRLIGMEFVALQLQGSLRREIDRYQPDLVHASFLIPCGQLAVRQSLPSIVTTHGTDGYGWPFRRPGLYRAAREALLKATRVTAVSHYLRRRVQSIVPRDVRVIWNGANERVFHPRSSGQSRRRLALPSDRFIIAYAGAILRTKGLFELVAAAGSQRVGDRPLLALAGAGKDEYELRAQAQRAGVDARFLGPLGHDDVAELFGAADLVTLPSYNEGLPNIVCEAMLSERPVLATTVGGIPEIIEDGHTGLLVAPQNHEELAAKLRLLIGDGELRSRLATAARAFASENLTRSVSAHGYDDLYREVITEARASTSQKTGTQGR